ncbi:MAG TPA: HNH endonuclease signature motif containing protein, partial [Propionicimonas sp.]
GEEMRPPGRAAPGIRIPKIRIDVTVALSTLMGLDELPGELAGLGPIPAEQARALAAGGTWRRLVTHPLTGAVLDVGRSRYRPPQPIAEHVLARDGQCAGPGCSVPGHRCELDHTTEYHGLPANGSHEQGTTAADNLGPLSDRCHRLKTDGGFTLRQTAPGIFEWHTPAGLAYRVTPRDFGRTERLDKHTRSGYPDEPPF